MPIERTITVQKLATLCRMAYTAESIGWAVHRLFYGSKVTIGEFRAKRAKRAKARRRVWAGPHHRPSRPPSDDLLETLERSLQALVTP